MMELHFLTKLIFLLTLLNWSNALLWIHPGMNHVVACCDIISFNATELKVENKKLTNGLTILDNTRIVHPNVTDFQPQNLESTSIVLPEGAVVLPFITALNFRPHHWYNVCLTRHAQRTSGNLDDNTASLCFPVRPCECNCDNEETVVDGSPWLRVLVNASFKSELIDIRLSSSFSSDHLSTTMRVRFNLILQSETYYKFCNKLEPPSKNEDDEEMDEKDEEEYQMRLRQCRREPKPIEAKQIHPSEHIQIQKKEIGRLPFYILITVNMTDSQKFWAREIVHKLEPVKVTNEKNNGDSDNNHGNNDFRKWITLAVPTPKIEEQRPVLDWDDEDSKKLCPILNQIDCTKSVTCSRAGPKISDGFTIFFLVLIMSMFFYMPIFLSH